MSKVNMKINTKYMVFYQTIDGERKNACNYYMDKSEAIELFDKIHDHLNVSNPKELSIYIEKVEIAEKWELIENKPKEIETEQQAEDAIIALIDYSNKLGNPEKITKIITEELSYKKEHPTVVHHFAFAFLKGLTLMMDEYKEMSPYYTDERRRTLFEFLDRALMRI